MNKGYKLWHVIIIVIITAIISAVTTGTLLYDRSYNKNVNYSKYLLDSNVQNFLDSYDQIVNGFYENVDSKELMNSAIEGMTNYLNENYTSYLDEKEASDLVNSLNSTYTGIGVVISGNKVISILADSPASKAGIIEGDIINSINGNAAENLSSSEITKLIKDSDMINLEISRNDQMLNISIIASELSVPNLAYHIIDNTNIGYIQLTLFSTSSSKEVANAIERLKQLGMEKLIIDLRGNTGGYLEQAYNTASLFLEKGKTIYYLELKNKKKSYEDKTVDNLNIPIVILVNKSTASAAEILTAALKDSGNAVVVGQVTYGKGKVQHTYSLSNGSLLKYTSSRWLRPNGESIDEIGITPDYIITNEYQKEIVDDKEIITGIIDNQYNKAIELLK